PDRPHPTALQRGDEVVTCRASPQADQAEHGDRVHAVEKVTVDLQEVSEHEWDRERERAAPSQPRPASRDSELRARATPHWPIKRMRTHHSSFQLSLGEDDLAARAFLVELADADDLVDLGHEV